MPPLGKLHITKVYDVYTGAPLTVDGDQDVTIHDIDRTVSPADSVVAVVYDDQIQNVWKK
jgi:hypothetical protein